MLCGVDEQGVGYPGDTDAINLRSEIRASKERKI